MLPVVLRALLPAAGNLLGGVLAEVLPESSRWRSHALHAAVGFVFGVVGIAILPEALGVLDAWQLAAAFVVGGLAYLLVRAPVEASGDGDGSTRMWMIYAAVAADCSATA